MNDFEELNNIEVSKPRSIPYEEYFGEMDLSDEQKEKRISFAEQMDDVMLFIFALFTVYRSYEMEPSYSFIVNELVDEYKLVAGNYTEIDKHLNDYIEEKHYLDIDEKKSDGFEYTATGGGKYSLPVENAEKILIRNYISYDSQGIAQITDYRLVEYLCREGK